MVDKKSTRAREKRMRNLGLSRYRSRQAVAYGQQQADVQAQVLPTHFSPERCLMTEAARRMAKRVDELCADYLGGKAGPVAASIPLLVVMPADVASIIASRVIIDCLARGMYYQQIAAAVGQHLRDEAMLRALKEKSKTEYLNYRRDNRRTKTRKRSAANANKDLKRRLKALDLSDWSSRDATRIGSFMLEVMAEVSGLISFKNIGLPDGRKGVRKLVVPTPETVEWLRKAHEMLAAAKPFWLPINAPPKDWASVDNGGYWTEELPKFPLIKGVDQVVLDINGPDMCPEVYRAVNHLQHCGYLVNRSIYDIAKELWERDADTRVLPKRTDAVPPPNPGHAKDSEEHRQWRKAAAKVHTRNREYQAQRIQVSRTLLVAKEMGTDPFFFPYQLDFRGRVYAVPSFLNPQGDDLARGLLQFRDGVPLDARARAWLKRHIANCWGYDKAAWNDRELWVDKHEERIFAAANDPLSDAWWHEADKPWQFLAACIEWRDQKVLGEKFLSRIPIQLDGSNNGLQLFSLMLRDKYGAIATNCAPASVPQDIYQRVADRVRERLIESYEHPMSKGWLDFWQGQIPRNLVKRSVMVLPYGATIYTSQKYVSDYYADYVYERRLAPISDTDSYRYLLHLNNLVWESINEIVVGAKRAMDWLHQVANACTAEKKPVEWRTPVGFFVRHAYPDQRSAYIRTAVGDRYVVHRIREPLKTLSRTKQRSALSPNFVHSLDAAVLVRAVNRMAELGVGQISCVHDSFGVPATQVDLLTQSLKAAALGIFEHNVLAELADMTKLRLTNPEAVPAPPEQGDFDLQTLNQSEYFFS